MKINSNEGNITFLGILFTLLLFSMLISIVYLEKKNYFSLKNRYLTYLCFRHHLIKTKKYVKNMEQLNSAIAIAYPLTLVPVTAAQANATINALKITQNILHGSHLKNISLNKFCTYQQNIASTINLPYKTINLLILERTLNHMVIPRKNKWNLIIPSINKYQRKILPDFYLKAEVERQFQSPQELKISTTEINSKVGSVF